MTPWILRTAVVCVAGTAGCALDLHGELTSLGDAGADLNGQGHLNGDDGGGTGFGSGDDATSAPQGGDGGPGNVVEASGGEGGSSSEGGGATTCDFNGVWATKLHIAVDWTPQGITGVILAPGTGSIDQWVLSTRTQTGLMTTDTTIVCGISLPDFSGTSFVGGETYGVRFPNTLFDDDYLPSFTIEGTLGDSTPKATFNTGLSAALLGITMTNPTTAPWPATITTAVDSDQDGDPGVTVNAAAGSIPGGQGSYSLFPVDGFKTRATQLFIVIRQVTRLSGKVDDCDHISGSITIPKIATSAGSSPKYGIDSHVIGCTLAAGGNCSASQINFIDATQPVFSPSGETHFASMRISSPMTHASCADVRAMLP
jgi:hypothetical protein